MDGEKYAEVLVERLKIFWKATKNLEKRIASPSFLESEETFSRRNRSPLVSWFKSLPHLHLPDGMVPDYYHFGTHHGSAPVLYARKKSSPRVKDHFGYYLGDEKPEGTMLMEAVVPDKTMEGIWELILLDEMGGQFGLYWHAGYDLSRILYDWGEFFKGKKYAGLPDDGECLLGDKGGTVTEEEHRELLSWNIAPYVTMKDDRAFAHYCVFTPFGGFFKVRRTVILSPELEIKKPVILKKVEYNCGIVY